MKNKTFSSLLLSGLLSFIFAAAVQAGGLSMINYGEVLVENLSVGGVYSMTQVANLPLLVKNQSDNPIKVQLSVLKPSELKAKKGFKPIPDTSWVKISEPLVDIAANGTYSTDVVISIPDKKEFLSKKYHVNIQAKIIPEKSKVVNVALAVEGRLLFTVAPVKQAQTDAGAKNASLDFNFVPALVKLSEVSLGGVVPVLGPENAPVLIKNMGKEKLTVILSSLDINQTVAAMEPGYETTPDLNFMSFTNDELTVGAGAEAPIQAVLNIPDKPEYRGKHYVFLVSASTSGATDGKRYLRVLVNTKE